MPDRGAHITATLAPRVPVNRLILGKPAPEVAVLLPRVFNLCRAAQSMAATLALGLPAAPQTIKTEIIRDHLMKLCIAWPRLVGADRVPLPQGWQSGDMTAVLALTGPYDVNQISGFEALLEAAPIGRTLAGIRDRFAPFEAAVEMLPMPNDASLFAARPAALENSVAARHAAHPVMVHIEDMFGRGPFWRASARLFDLMGAAEGRLPAPRLAAPGRAAVPAARGTYGVAADVDGFGNVATIQRITPTDHLMAPGGIMDQSLMRLGAENHGAAPLLLDILDPCSPVEIKEVVHA